MTRPEPPPLPDSLRDLNVEELVGLPLDEARRVAEGAGGNVQVVAGEYMTADLVRNRLRVRVEHDRVSEIVSRWS
jgi:hypothetical protein